ncbi:MAG: hypothetical protein VX908_04155 [Planctomycetota bacterium]|nr:hypothetical protein [Planctomycetota bacterium]
MTTRRTQPVARPRAAAKAADKRSSVRVFIDSHPTLAHGVFTMVKLPWSIYCHLTNRRTGPNRRN